MDGQGWFWIMAALMLALALALTALPVVRGRRGTDRNRVVRALLQQEIEENERDRRTGLLSEAAYEQSLHDIEYRALEEMKAGEPRSRCSLLAGTALAAVAVWIVLASVTMYWQLGRPTLIDLFEQTPKGGAMQVDGSLGSARTQASTEQLRTYLERSPSDERAWVLLARSYHRQQDTDKKLAAYERAVALHGKVAADVSVLLEYGTLALMQSTAQTDATAYRVLGLALGQGQRQRRVHELYALACLQTQRWDEAYRQFDLALSLMQPEDPGYERIAAAAAYVAQRARQTDRSTP